MARIRFTAAYDGRPYLGWQSQPGGRTVQDVLERAFSALFSSPVRIHGSGRTDAGVHALGQVFHVDAPDTHRIPADKWPTALNTRLPRTIRITHAEYVHPGFHARFSASGKTYRYCISRAPVLSPFDAGLAWHRPLSWSTNTLEQAVSLFLGTHDFTAFAALRGNEPRPIPADYFRRTITQADVRQEGEHVFITFTGTGFLYKMVRLMAGAAHEAARGKMALEELARLINLPRPGDKSPFCAPPDGLTLMQVHYPAEAPEDKTE
ncbi:tRNA pseudouridine(38-40) synthase TruA [uncultured Akkermansia sp.]|uniref:tRNA pseudouridine(38-40) synthase TruA n=1 Tax=uncultured Akkermansia sp. TaxID=512294 RepID=UPI00265CE5D0|nr:tRNA pseudouridine(38-40) synthase TruA [uncultured Akkermansia sp.]